MTAGGREFQVAGAAQLKDIMHVAYQRVTDGQTDRIYHS